MPSSVEERLTSTKESSPIVRLSTFRWDTKARSFKRGSSKTAEAWKEALPRNADRASLPGLFLTRPQCRKSDQPGPDFGTSRDLTVAGIRKTHCGIGRSRSIWRPSSLVLHPGGILALVVAGTEHHCSEDF